MINKLLFTALLFIFTLNVFSQVPNYVPTNGLVGYWPFNGNANDESGNGNNGTVNGATLTTDRFGNANSAYNFDGQSYISVPHTNMLNFGFGDYSLSVWANKSGNSWLHNLIAKATPHPATGWCLGFVNSDIRFLAGVQNSNSLSNGDVSYGPISNGEWNNYIAVFNPTMNSIKIYKNGQIVVATIVSSSLINSDNIYDLMFGVSNPNGAPSGPEFFQGFIDEVGIWNRALTQQEITNLYTSTVPVSCLPAYVPTSGLVGYWPFCGNANDESGNGNNGTVNGATLTTDRFGNANSAYSFDGVNDWIEVADNSELNPTAITIAAWVKALDYNSMGASMAVNKGWDQSAGHYDLLLFSSNHKSRFVLGSDIYVESSSTVDLNEWVFLTASISGLNAKIYVNGVLENSTTLTSNNSLGSSTAPLYFGKHDYNGAPYVFNGILDDISIYNRALTPAEITQLYTDASVTPSVACTPFLGEDQTVCAGTSVQLNVNSTSVNSSLALLETYSHDVGSEWTHNFSVVPGQTYTVRVSAQFSMGTVCPNFEMDPAYWIPPYNGGVALTHGCNSAWYIQNYCNGTLGMRPTPDVYNPQHTYDYPIVANSNVLTVGFADCCLGDNCGSISFELHQSITSSTYLWSNGATTPTINVSPTSTTTYTCTTTTNGVSCTDSVTIVVNNPTINLGNDVNACGTSTTLTAPTGFDSYLWSNGGTTNTTTVSSNGAYSCTGLLNGCSVIDSIDVVLVSLDAQVNVSSICAGEAIELTATSNLSVNQNSNCIGNTGSPNPWSYPSAYNGGIIDLGNFGAQSVFSISAWVNVGATQNGISILLDASHGGSANWVVQAFGNNTYTWGSLSFTLTPNVWQHVLLTYVNGSKKCFIDGQLVASVYNPISYSGSPQLYLGNWPEGGRRFNGLVDELYITYSELQSSNFVPSQVINAPSANSFGLWHFDEGANGTTLNSVNGTVAQIGSWFWASRPVVGNATISWNGVPGSSTQTLSPVVTTTYVSSVLINGLTCSDSVTVAVNNPVIDLGADVTVCGTSTTLTAPTGNDSYVWSNGGTTNSTTVNASGTYSCMVTQGLCSASDSIDVVLVPLTINTTNISAAATYTWENNGQTYTSSGIYTGITVNCETQVLNLTITPSSPTLSLQVFLDGYYINSLNPAAMTAARYNNLVASGSANPGANTDVDVITVELRSPSNLDVVAYSVSPILQTNGSVQCVFPAGALGGSFYIVVKHRAANPLWSANPIILTTSTTYDFANNIGSAYSNGDLSLAPMHTIVSSLYGIWLGELNEDGYLDATDYSNLELDIYASGYLGLYLLDGDLNGDTYVDASDFAVFESNSIYGPYEQRPYAIATNVSIGQSYQGGIVAYILQPGDAGYDANVQHGLIAAPSDQGTAQWGCTWTTAVSGAYGQAIGTGAQNTINIMNGCSEAGIAARLCGDLILDGYSDWYLPSLDELNKLYLNKVAIGGFAAGNFPISIYWSSTAFNNGNNDAAWGLFFYDGIQYPKAKVDYLSVRAVRAF